MVRVAHQVAYKSDHSLCGQPKIWNPAVEYCLIQPAFEPYTCVASQQTYDGVWKAIRVAGFDC